ncbi:MAG: hypothetical protein KA505_10440 [Xanthomonadales bacterium]|nr:hypothetical protein [Xanthomonadales bacterium]MBP6079220.1 hypothetical protein [Xanthomonadales bacterium]MBP7622707.1 hypothetical protein [Xanthomonadales bacterium]
MRFFVFMNFSCQGRFNTTQRQVSTQAGLVQLKGRVDEHVQKLKDYKRNPDKFDNEGTLANAPSAAVREKIIAGRVKALEGQLKKNEGELKKVVDQLEKSAE